VKSMIEMHGGRLRLQSALGNGTLVELHFPAERISAARENETIDDGQAAEKQRARRTSHANR
jgi:hypothetical protein